MKTIEEMEKLIKREIKLLEIVDKKTNVILSRKNEREMERKKRLFVKKLKKMQEVKTNVIKQKLSEDKIEAEEWGTQTETALIEMKLIMLDNLNTLYAKYKQRRWRKRNKKNSKDNMKRNNGNSKKKNKGNNRSLNRKKSENSVNSRKNKEVKNSNFKCNDATEKKGGIQLQQKKKV